ncbi:response regulator transcription factor [Sphingomonas sp. AOB5]|uniref:response regulator transcription factor n=1 Tax=Sphingomonas sp. AOB5 TaxID=3034017 RepID=UPI0023F68CBF|nr:response regulator transcription factor [Sphingomonas sp. AOB5]MDF7775413.1 response regulator transcription factor [Sphingomonas sp. AOB5]
MRIDPDMANGANGADEQEPARAKIVLVEDDASLLAYAGSVLAGASDIEVVGQAECVADALALVALAPDLALLDLGMPDGSGIEVLTALRRDVPGCKILVFTVFEDRASVINTLKAGADGYILKDTSPEQLLAHVRATIAGETPISSRAASHLLSLVRDDPPEPDPAIDTPQLSPRERELLEYLARGLGRKEAARVMGISPYTVAEYIQGIYRKLQVRSRGEAVYEAVQAKLITLDRS